MRVLKLLVKSRKAWVGALTTLVSVVAVIVLPKVGVDQSEANVIAGAVVTLGVALMAAIAGEDFAEKMNLDAEGLARRDREKGGGG